jgi:Ca2+-binding EF-hand superfamily protein
MKTRSKISLVLGAAALLGGTGLAIAQMDGPPPPDGPMQGLMHREPFGERLLGEFDANHDGKITHAEFNNVLGSRFARVTRGSKQMTADQLWSLRQAGSAAHTAEMFRRIDWNGDGRLTLDEYAAPQRAHFAIMDHKGTGTVSCSPFERAAYEGGRQEPRGFGGRRGGGGFGGFELARFCSGADVSRDGTVTRAELDSMTKGAFVAASNGASSMTLLQFATAQAAQFRALTARAFKRLDGNGDGKLTLAEFAEPSEKMFDRLDRNRDGIITSDETKPRFRGRGQGGHDRGDGSYGSDRER